MHLDLSWLWKQQMQQPRGAAPEKSNYTKNVLAPHKAYFNISLSLEWFMN